MSLPGALYKLICLLPFTSSDCVNLAAVCLRSWQTYVMGPRCRCKKLCRSHKFVTCMHAGCLLCSEIPDAAD